jgi:hypothetical protein
MQVLILLGKKADRVPVCLYCGLDGVELQKAADLARSTGEFVEIGRSTNPMTAPLPVSPSPTKVSGIPKFPERKSAKKVEVSNPPKHIEKFESDLARQRKDRFKVSVDVGPKGVSEAALKTAAEVVEKIAALKPKGPPSRPPSPAAAESTETTATTIADNQQENNETVQ